MAYIVEWVLGEVLRPVSGGDDWYVLLWMTNELFNSSFSGECHRFSWRERPEFVWVPRAFLSTHNIE